MKRALLLDDDELAFLQRLLEDPFTYADQRFNTPVDEHTPAMLADEDRREQVLNRVEALTGSIRNPNPTRRPHQ